ncbi:MAG: fatty acid oxidation complex subunit alpha FadJ [Deltaproteobacteria bacterium HGW-Deltaproteobacteria-12]|jgi:3-hydroxyacyl-CoA dehydrogenase/enoyl-CoA hydratase/3-hydroxybutyryl-CoA epimerase|nr:MAG: fatty acid oxidation complex subunit alpha FadJ [Deltaproteobacteria bacterium HGW-Deltaproteobacteria-12]
MNNLALEITKEGIAVVTVDCPDGKVNKISSGLLREVAANLQSISNDPKVAGMVIVSGKQDNFVVGAAIDELQAMRTKEEVVAYIALGHSILNDLENMKIPVVACIAGNCLGGGLELALACNYRMAVNSPQTVLGFPEVQLGLLPAGGGTQRLPRLIGLTAALPMLLTAKNLRAKKAKKAGLVDELIAPYGAKETAVKKALELARKGSSKRKRQRSFVSFLLESNPVGRAVVFAQARKMIARQTYGCYPAPYAIIEAVEEGQKHGKAAGLKKEIELLAKLVVSSQSKALMSLFFGMADMKKNPQKELARKVGKLAIIGTGLMGQGIAAVSASVSDTILLKDVSLDAAARGMKEIWKGLDKKARSGAIVPFERDVQYGKLVPTDTYSLFKNTELVVEAVFEDLALKKRVLSDVEEAADENTIFASNTSAIPIADIAAGCRRPQNVIGMHYFSPVPRMPLLEIITTDKTAPWVAATALEMGISQGKTCIVVKDGPGFYTTRILSPMLNEVVLLLEEGAIPNDIDLAMRRFGYPVGPVALLDEVGIDVGAHVAEVLSPLFVQRGMAGSDSLPQLFAHGYYGKKNRKGFYRYDGKKKKGQKIPNAEVYALIGGAPRRKFDAELIQQRVSLMMINEALICLQEGIISCPRDGDIGAVFGLGFPPFEGGPFRYIDRIGPARILEMLESLQKTYGGRFHPPQILQDIVRSGRRFHDE